MVSKLFSRIRSVPEKLRSWRHLDPDHYHACFRCSASDRLTTIALERDGIVYGFLFTCGRCLLETDRGSQVVWRVKE
jgi:hypothetical protein